MYWQPPRHLHRQTALVNNPSRSSRGWLWTELSLRTFGGAWPQRLTGGQNAFSRSPTTQSPPRTTRHVVDVTLYRKVEEQIPLEREDHFPMGKRTHGFPLKFWRPNFVTTIVFSAFWYVEAAAPPGDVQFRCQQLLGEECKDNIHHCPFKRSSTSSPDALWCC